MEANRQEPHMNSKFSYLELHTGNLDRAKAFYAELFGWKITQTPMPMPYLEVSTGEGISGGMMGLQGGEPPAWLTYVQVAKLDESLAQTTRLGGQVLSPVQTVPEMGRFAVIQDPTGARLALWQPVT
jgi:hypothetical protein